MKYNIEQVINNVYEKTKDLTSYVELRAFLFPLIQNDNKTPRSTGNKLKINQLLITNTDDKQSTFNFYTGVNTIIADNLKGKSSIFKMIKLCLTGANKLKPDINKSIKKISLNFSINDDHYCSEITKTGTTYTCHLAKVRNTNVDFNHKIEDSISPCSLSNYSKKVQEFFFEKFSYYPLFWTQKSSQKDKNELQKSTASWKTYFKSIYLESKDSSTFYGSQGKKIFQMLLGLNLTTLINDLTVILDQKKFLNANNSKNSTDELNSIEIRLSKIEDELKSVLLHRSQNLNLDELIISHSLLSKELNSEIIKYQESQNLIVLQTKELTQLELQLLSLEKDHTELNKKLSKNIKLINDLKEYLEFQVFFSNLNISNCPSCNTNIKIPSAPSNSCMLCHEPIQNLEHEVDTTSYESKITIMNDENSLINLEIVKIADQILATQNKISEIKQKVEIISSSTSTTSIEQLKNEMEILNTKITDATKKIDFTKEHELISERAVLNFKKNNMLSTVSSSNFNLDKEIQILELTISELESIQYNENKSIIDRLSSLILTELKQLNLTSINEILITERFDIKYKQSDDYLTFDQIAEGEQLRVKLAFYLALIKLDIEFNFGRHSRLLFIDSPNKEEGDSAYLNGFIEIVQNINMRFNEELQIVICTAERNLEDVVSNQRIFKTGEYLF